MSTEPVVPDDLPLSKARQLARPWVCKAGTEGCERTKPCRSCLGRRNRRKGKVAERQARKALGLTAATLAHAAVGEEALSGPVRVEIKAGAQAKPVWTRYALSEAQSEAGKAAGDTRPFLAVFKAEGTSDGLYVGRLSKVRDVAAALCPNCGGGV